uniref:Uncharacterized protein n=2 Tax=Clastoptera arizonana TaxID=38151 RepID=A0A1B6BX75_9HEMI
MNPTTIKEILPGNFNNLCMLDEYKEIATKKVKHDIDNKKQEIYLSSFIIENCMFLLWTHLDYYMLRAIPNKTLGVDSSLVFGRSSQMAEITWNATVEEINVLKQGLVFAFNDTFCKNLIATTQDQKAINKGYVEALLRRIKKLIQFVPSK